MTMNQRKKVARQTSNGCGSRTWSCYGSVLGLLLLWVAAVLTLIMLKIQTSYQTAFSLRSQTGAHRRDHASGLAVVLSGWVAPEAVRVHHLRGNRSEG